MAQDMTYKRSEIVNLVVKALYEHRCSGPCADGPDCLYCPVEAIVDSLLEHGLIEVAS